MQQGPILPGPWLPCRLVLSLTAHVRAAQGAVTTDPGDTLLCYRCWKTPW